MGPCQSTKNTTDASQIVTKTEDITVTPANFVVSNKVEILQKYSMTKTLGEGTFGKVTKAIIKKSGEIRAIKMIDKKPYIKNNVVHQLIDEVSRLKELSHPNIIKIFEYTEDNRYFYMVTEYCSGGDLFEIILAKGSISESETAAFMQQLFSAVAYLHEKGVVHRDLKPNNLMVEDPEEMTVKLIDFGAAIKMEKDIKLTEIQGTVRV